MGFSFGHRPKPKPFGFIPRYYDEQKEEREKRLAQIDNPDRIDVAKDRIRSGFKSSYRGDAKYKKSQTRQSNKRLVYIVIILALITVLIMRSEMIAKFITAVGG